MPGKSPHAHERPAWHAPAQRPCTGQRPGAAARPHPRGMSFCPSKAISHPVPKPRLRGLSRAMAPRPVPPHRGPPRERLPSPANRAAKRPRGSQPTASNAESTIKSRVRKERAAFPWPAIPAAINKRLFAPQKKRASPGRRRILPKANAPVPPHRGPPRERLPSPANRAAKKAPWEPTDRLQRPRGVFPLFAPSFPEHRREWACALGRAGPFRLHTRRLARRTLLSRAESAHPGALGMPANAKIALIYKNQVRFCFPGWRTFSTPGAPLTALPRAPRCRVRG